MSLLLFIGVPLIFFGGCLTAAGFLGPTGSTFVSGYRTSGGMPIPSRVLNQPYDGERKKKMRWLGLKLCAIGAVLVVVAG